MTKIISNIYSYTCMLIWYEIQGFPFLITPPSIKIICVIRHKINDNKKRQIEKEKVELQLSKRVLSRMDPFIWCMYVHSSFWKNCLQRWVRYVIVFLKIYIFFFYLKMIKIYVKIFFYHNNCKNFVNFFIFVLYFGRFSSCNFYLQPAQAQLLQLFVQQAHPHFLQSQSAQALPQPQSQESWNIIEHPINYKRKYLVRGTSEMTFAFRSG